MVNRPEAALQSSRRVSEAEQGNDARGELASKHERTARRWGRIKLIRRWLFRVHLALILVSILAKNETGVVLGACLVPAWLLEGMVWAVVGRTPALLEYWHLQLAYAWLRPTGDEVARQCLLQGRPLALFLRSFDMDDAAPPLYGFEKMFDPAGEVDRYRHPVEPILAKYFHGKGVSIVAIENPFIRRRNLLAVNPKHRVLSGIDIPRVSIQDGEWESMVRELALRSQAIVMFVSGETPGVLKELQILRDSGAVGRTLLIVGATYAGGDGRLHPDALSGFPRLVFEETKRTSRSFYHVLHRNPASYKKALYEVLDAILASAGAVTRRSGT